MEQRFRLEYRESTFSLVGELDLATSRSFEEHVVRRFGDLDDVIVFDLSRLTLVDASGLSTFVKIERKLRDAERFLVLRNALPNVRRVLDATGLTWLLERRLQPSESGLVTAHEPSPVPEGHPVSQDYERKDAEAPRGKPRSQR